MQSAIKEYWERSTPMGFRDKPDLTIEEKAAFRYNLQSYMRNDFGFDRWAGKRLLEVGCGAGIDSITFAKNGAIVTACDITESAIELTKKHKREAKVKLTVVRQEQPSVLPFDSGVFDVVYSFGVLHHIPDVDGMLREIRRVLAPGGQFMGMVYNRDSILFAWLWFQYARDLKRNEGNETIIASGHSERNMGCPYTRVYSVEEAKTLFGVYFNKVTVHPRYNVIDTEQQRKVKLGLSDKHGLGWHLIVKGVK